VVAEVVERLERTETVITADFRGLTVAELADLRGKLRDADAEMTVIKNTLSRRAANETGREALLPYLQGPTGLVWVNGDPAQAAKALSEFAKGHKDVFTIRGGVLGANDLPAESIGRLASLPTREQMLGQLAGTLISPISGLAGRLNGLIGKLARTLSAVGDSDALAPGEAPAAAEAAVAPEAAEAPAEEAVEAPAEQPAAEVTEDASVEESPAAEAPADDADAEVPAEAQEPVADDATDAPVDGESETPES
jgi:large subunit ribosomal protein L10